MILVQKNELSPLRQSSVLYLSVSGIGNFNASFCSSEYYRASRSLYLNEMTLEDLVADIVETTDANIEYAIPNFVTKIEKHFSNGGGFYYLELYSLFLI